MILALDVHYPASGGAVVGAVLFQDWADAEAVRAESLWVDREIAPYEPGAFYRRELPCLLDALANFSLGADGVQVVVVDGLVDLGPERPGLGRHLFEALPPGLDVVGVAKTSFHAHTGVAVIRGTDSRRPLFVNAAVQSNEVAAAHIRTMSGPFRIPTLLKLADSLSRRPRDGRPPGSGAPAHGGA